MPSHDVASAAATCSSVRVCVAAPGKAVDAQEQASNSRMQHACVAGSEAVDAVPWGLGESAGRIGWGGPQGRLKRPSLQQAEHGIRQAAAHQDPLAAAAACPPGCIALGRSRHLHACVRPWASAKGYTQSANRSCPAHAAWDAALPGSRPRSTGCASPAGSARPGRAGSAWAAGAAARTALRGAQGASSPGTATAPVLPRAAAATPQQLHPSRRTAHHLAAPPPSRRHPACMHASACMFSLDNRCWSVMHYASIDSADA